MKSTKTIWGGATLNKKAFTLIELLAVIVILAIIALIATPIILNIIEDARKESAERSVELYASAIKNAIAAKQLTGASPTKIEQLDMDEYYSGDVTCETTQIDSNGNVYLAKCTVNGTLLEGYTYGEKFLYEDGEIVYFNVTTGAKCTESDYTANTDKEGKTGCLKFYAFLDDGGKTIDLLLDHNTTAMVAWNSSGSNTSGPNEVTTQLASDTANWTGVEIPENYTDARGYTVTYTNARLITANEIAEITGNTGWDSGNTASSWYYFDSITTSQSETCKSGDTSGCAYGWLYDKTSTNCTDYGCNSNSTARTCGYWTVSSYASYSGSAWYVNYDGYVSDGGDVYHGNFVNYDGPFGVRPVITVLKSHVNVNIKS